MMATGFRICALALALGAAMVSAGATSAAAAATAEVAASPDAVGFDAARLQKLDKALAKVVADGRVAGMSTLLVRHGKLVDTQVFGKQSLATGQPMSRDTIVRIYSMSKPITGVAMMILYEEGKWRLDDPITKFIPEFKGLRVISGVDDKGAMITVPVTRPPTLREIMSHTAGFGYGLQDNNPVDHMFREKRVLAADNLPDLIHRVADIPLKFQPGTDWSYSVSVDIQGYLIEKISGQKLGDFLAQRIFQPLKMTDTAFSTGTAKAARLAALYVGDEKTGKLVEPSTLFGGGVPDYVNPPGLESGGGGLVSTLGDYGRFCQMILNGGELDGVRILAPRTIALMGTDVVPQAALVKSNGTASQRFGDSVGFGLDFMVMKDPLKAGSLEGKGVLSWGGAASTWFWIDPANDLYFVGMVQRLGGTGGDDLGLMTRTLTYQALIHPEK